MACRWDVEEKLGETEIATRNQNDNCGCREDGEKVGIEVFYQDSAEILKQSVVLMHQCVKNIIQRLIQMLHQYVFICFRVW